MSVHDASDASGVGRAGVGGESKDTPQEQELHQREQEPADRASSTRVPVATRQPDDDAADDVDGGDRDGHQAGGSSVA